MNQVQLVIPMSGVSRRFTEVGYTEPKSLLKIEGEKRMIEYVLNMFPNEKDVSFICNDKHLRETNMRQILQDICNKQGRDCKIYEVPVEGRRGPVHAVSLIHEHLDDNKETIVSYCDYGTLWDYNMFLKDTRDRNADGAIVCYCEKFNPTHLEKDFYAYVSEIEEDTRWMKAIREKRPFTSDKTTEFISNGAYYFKTGAIMKKYFNKQIEIGNTVKNEFYVSETFNLLAQDKLKVSIYELDGYMLQWGIPSHLEMYKKWSDYFAKIIHPQPKFMDNNNTTLILPLAGFGSRFSKDGFKIPKPLLKVNESPMIIQAVKCLPQSTNQTFIYLDEHNKKYNINNEIKKYYPNMCGVSIDKTTNGQATTCWKGIQHNSNINSDDAVFISACDNGVYYDVEKYQQLVDDKSVDVIVWSFRNEQSSKSNPQMYAWMETDEDNNILSVSCKCFDPEIHNVNKSHVIIGSMFFRKCSYFTNGYFKNVKEDIRSNNEFYVDDVINQCIKQGLKVKVFEVEHYICWGTPNDYKTYNYFQQLFESDPSHPYSMSKDTTFYNKK